MTAPTAGIVGEAGPEAIIRLTGAGAGAFAPTVNVNVSGNSFGTEGISEPGAMFREFAEKIAYEVRRVIADEHRRSAVI